MVIFGVISALYCQQSDVSSQSLLRVAVQAEGLWSTPVVHGFGGPRLDGEQLAID
jgi:hypothetical protein